VSSISHTKTTLRKQCLAINSQISAVKRAHAGQEVAVAVFNLLKSRFHKANTIAYFHSFKDEIDTHFLGDLLKENNYRRLLPQLDGTNLYFIDEDTHKEVVLNEIDIVIVPGVAFDKHGNRLGRGLGCYDRFLSTFVNRPIKPFTIGIGFDEQLFEQIPIDTNDQPLNMIVTPSFKVIV